MIEKGTTVAVIDDVIGHAETAAGIAEEAGLLPLIISENDGVFMQTGDLLERIRQANCMAVICDHRLNHTQFAPFTGAEFMAKLYSVRIPGVLLSTFAAIDDDTSIRLYRANIPSLIAKGNLEPDEIMEGLLRCESEIAGDITPERTPRRSLVRVTNVSTESDIPVVDAIVHSWDPGIAVRFPLAMIEDSAIQEMLTSTFSEDVRLFAQVNVGCRDANELFFKSFEMAPVRHGH